MAQGLTLSKKLIARAAGRAHVTPGEIVTCRVDLAFAHDSSGPRRWAPMLKELGRGLWDPSKIVIVSDHYTPAADAESASILKLTRDFAAEHGVDRFFDMEGIAHTLLPQNGLLKPGMFVAGGDSRLLMSANGIAVLALGILPQPLMAVCVQAIGLSF